MASRCTYSVERHSVEVSNTNIFRREEFYWDFKESLPFWSKRSRVWKYRMASNAASNRRNFIRPFWMAGGEIRERERGWFKIRILFLSDHSLCVLLIQLILFEAAIQAVSKRDRSYLCCLNSLLADTVDAIQSLMALNYPIPHHFTILNYNVTRLVVSWGAYLGSSALRVCLCKGFTLLSLFYPAKLLLLLNLRLPAFLPSS